LALLSILGDVASDDVKWAAALAAFSVLLYRETTRSAEIVEGCVNVADRSEFETYSLSVRLEKCQELCVFAPSAVNLLSAQVCDVIRRHVLSSPSGRVRVVVLDPENSGAIALATRQLDDSLDFPVQSFPRSLEASVEQLRTMRGWATSGRLEIRYLDRNPGFSIVLVDGHARSGEAIVEFHGFHNEATNSRMHLRLMSERDEPWFSYWRGQFDHIWQAGRPAP
jgi:hypothetical protein